MRAIDEKQDEALEDSAAAGDELKKAYKYTAKSRRRKIALGMAAVGGAAGVIMSGGLLGVAGLVGGGLAGNYVGKKAEETAETKAEKCKFEGTDPDN